MEHKINLSYDLTTNVLQRSALDGSLTDLLPDIFGENYNIELADNLVRDFANGNFEDLPLIEIVPRSLIAGGNGAYDRSNNVIYLAEEFVTASSSSSIKDVWLEEIGHYIDGRINEDDTSGDEGYLFSQLVQGNVLSDEELTLVIAEDDSTTVEIDGRITNLELAATPIEFSDELTLTANWDLRENGGNKFRLNDGTGFVSVESDRGTEVASNSVTSWIWSDLNEDGILSLDEANEAFKNAVPYEVTLSTQSRDFTFDASFSVQSNQDGSGLWEASGTASLTTPSAPPNTTAGEAPFRGGGTVRAGFSSSTFVADPGPFEVSDDSVFRIGTLVRIFPNGGSSIIDSNIGDGAEITEAGVYTVNFVPTTPAPAFLAVGGGFFDPEETVESSGNPNSPIPSSFEWSFVPYSPEPTISISDPYILISNENNEPRITKNIVVKLSEPSQEEVTVEYSTLDGTATTGDDGQPDYATKSGTVTFAPGETEQEISIEVFRDREINSEDFEVFSRDTAYRTQADGNTNLESGTDVDVFGRTDRQPYGDLGYRVDQEFNTENGFQAYGLTSDEEFYLVLKNPENAILANQIDDGGISFQNQFEKEYVTNKLIFSENDVITDNPITGKALEDLGREFNSLAGSEWSLNPITIYDADKPPVLAVRGTEFGRETADLLDDANPQGIGTDQYQAASNEVNQWLEDISQPEDDIELRPNITGHSLGGALSQLIASGSPVQLDRLITFNSPGISENQVNNSQTDSVIHYITRGDFVSLAGDEFLSGNYILSSYLSNPISIIAGEEFKHSVPVTGITEIVDGLSTPEDFQPGNRLLSSEDLSGFFFNYIGDPGYFGFQLIVASGLGSSTAAGLTFRGTTEALRETLGDGLWSVLSSLDYVNGLTQEVQAAIDSFKQYSTDALEALEEITKRELFPDGFPNLLRTNLTTASFNSVNQFQALQNDTTSNGLSPLEDPTTIDTFWEAIPNFSVAAWEATAVWIPEAWAAIVEWSPEAWTASVEWTDENWQTTTEWTAETWQSTTEFTPEQWQNVFSSNNPPVAENDTATTNAGGAVTIDVLNNDSDPDADVIVINTFDETSTEGGSITLDDNGTPDDESDDQLVYTPADGFSGTDTFTYTVSDGTDTATATVNIEVGVNVDGGNGKDALEGTPGNDNLDGGNGKDALSGLGGDDNLVGGNGADELTGGLGDDELTGGKGPDIFIFAAGDGTDVITDFGDGPDTIGLSSGLTFADLSFSSNDIIVSGSNEVLATLTGVDTTTLTESDFAVV